MTKKIFIWVAHPNKGTFCEALADQYEQGAKAQGAEVRRMELSDMEFDPHFKGYTKDMPELEPDLLKWQEHIAWADHIMVIHPYWWGAMPSLAKAVLDRGLTPGFAYKYHKKGVKWDQLLEGKTGDAIITSDTPAWLDSIVYMSTGRRVIKNQVFKFCGIKPKTIAQFGSIKMADDNQMNKWLDRANRFGSKAAIAA